ncbi:hypothetical protein B7R54_15430 [Subtercola boreus]|uniref:histidine kinase n=1 Tax=Subtercola boreus TaxID=120213 RepID=A0A3E0VNH5_9MICO|nr:histidine kinase [Subtercola boreus]RFA10437.1 hypothetical protein B7R54_15430 [Subtercola boreus]TQL56036.1 signal transduction histidine kinase [Subtercola boreus]
MLTALKALRPALLPAVAAVFLLLWIMAEVGRMHSASFYAALAAYAVAIGSARAFPRVALAILLVVPVAQAVGLLERPQATTWPIAGASILVAFAIATHARPRIRRAGLLVVVLQAVLLGFLLVYTGDWLDWAGGGQSVSPDTYLRYASTLAVLGVVFCAAAWTAGFALTVSARRRDDRALLDETEAELTAAGFELRSLEERARIAQEVHDVLAHSLAVVVAVADGSRFLRETKPETTDRALREIADTARAALGDLRGLIEGLRDETPDHPQPGLADLPALTSRLAAAGMPVDVQQFGAPQALTPSRDLAAYRIVQESLTNALRHSGAHPVAVVTFTWEGPGLALVVTSTGDGLRAGAGDGAGAGAGGGAGEGAGGGAGEGAGDGAADARPRFGLRGMEDRARLAGGWLTAGLDGGASDSDPAYIVTAYIPTAVPSAGAGEAAA